MPNPHSLPNLQISPQSFSVVENTETQVQLTLSTSSPIAFNTGYSICFNFPSSWTVTPVGSNWSYSFDKTTNLGFLTSTTLVTFPYTLSVKITCISQSASENISVFLCDNNNKNITNPTNISFSFLSPGNYLLAYATDSIFYFNSSSTQLPVENNLKSSLSFTESNTQSYNVGIAINFYTHDALGIIEQININNNSNFSLTVNSVPATPDSTRTTWTVPIQLVKTTESLSVKINNLNQLVIGKLLEIRYTISGVQNNSYVTSAYYQILGPFSISIAIDTTSSIETAQKASQYCLFGNSISGYTFGTLSSSANQPPFVFNVLDQFGMLIDPTSFQAERLLNGEPNFDTPLAAANILALQTSAGTLLSELDLNLQQINSTNLPSGWILVNAGQQNYLCGPGANLAGINLSGCNFANTNLSYTNLSGTNLSSSNLSFANLSGANLTSFSEAGTVYNTNLTGTNLMGANLVSVTSNGISGTPTTLPANWQLVNNCLVGPNVNLMNMNIEPQTNQDIVIDFSSANLKNANLCGANLTGDIKVFNTNSGVRENISYSISLDNANLSGANLSYASSGGIIGSPAALPVNWQLVNGYLIGPNADLSGSDLSQQDLSSINMANTNLIGANLNQTTFSNATVLDYITSGGVTGSPNLPSNWLLINGYLVGPKANLINADFSNQTLAKANLTNAQLISVNLSNADLSNVTLTGVVSGNIIGTPKALPSGWSLVNGCLIGP